MAALAVLSYLDQGDSPACEPGIKRAMGRKRMIGNKVVRFMEFISVLS